MINLELYRKNETSEEGRHRILDDIHLGDLIECLINQEYFKKPIDVPDRYVGFVVELTFHRIGLSTTHPSNASHGYSTSSVNYQKVFHPIEMETRLIQYSRQIDSREHEAL